MTADPLSDKDLADIQRRANHFEARRLDAEKQLLSEEAERPRGSHLYFGMIGFSAEEDHIPLNASDGMFAFIRKISKPPGEVELAAAVHPSHAFSRVAGYSHHFGNELVVRLRDGWQPSLNLAWWINCCIRIKTLNDFLVPVCADYAWETIPAVKDNSCRVLFLDDYPRAKRYSQGGVCTREDFDWVQDNIVRFADLLTNEPFKIAIEAFHSHTLSPNERLVAASLWSGMESLFSVDHEITFKLAAYVASMLEDRGERRLSLFEKVKKLYGERSRIVHGQKISEERLTSHIAEVRGILSRVLVHIVEAGKIPDRSELDKMLFS